MPFVFPGGWRPPRSWPGMFAAAQATLPGADRRRPAGAGLRAQPGRRQHAVRRKATAAEAGDPPAPFPDPRFRVELMDITRMGEQSPACGPVQRQRHQIR